MDILVYIAGFGTAVVFFLWLRDLRIFTRTAYPGYRSAAYWGILYSALALLGLAFTFFGSFLLGLGIVLAALYLQGRRKRERVWTGDEPAIERFLGKARRRKDKGTK